MKLNFHLRHIPFNISKQLLDILSKSIEQSAINPEQVNELIFTFKDPSYSVESGGYHPVEIRLIKTSDQWRFSYITDFSYVGQTGQNGRAELEKEIDFDFCHQVGFQCYVGEGPIEQFSELYQLWESNFIAYVQMGVFTTSIDGSF